MFDRYLCDDHMRVCNRYLYIGHSKQSTESVPKACVRPRSIPAVILIFVHVRPLAEDVILIFLRRLFTPGLHISMWGCLELHFVTQVTITCAGKDSLRGNYFIHQMQLLLGRMRGHVTFQSNSCLRLRYTRLVL